MKRDPEAEARKRYTRKNPPPDVPAAYERIDALATTEAQIKAELDVTRPDDFDDEDGFYDWRRRAVAALGHTRAEVAFVERWLKVRHQTEAQNGEGGDGETPKLQVIAQRIRTHADELARIISRECGAPRYTQEILPAHLDDAHSRIGELVATKRRIEHAFVEIGTEWGSYPLRKNDLPRVKAPLVSLLMETEAELLLVRQYIRSKQGGSSWRSVCATALRRATDHGFSLTEEEQGVLALLEQQLSS